jgi:hypothetical protein
MSALSTAAFTAGLTGLAPATSSAEISFRPGDALELPSTLTNRTTLVGAVGGRVLLPPVIGSVIDIPGDTANGKCVRPGQVDIGSIPPGSLLKTGVRVEVQPLAEVHFNEVIEKQKAASAGFLSFTADMGKDDRSEVMIEDVAGQQIINWDADKDPLKVEQAEAELLPPGMCGRYTITGVVLTAVSYRIFSSKKVVGSFLGLFNLGGKNYYSRTKQRHDLKVGIQLQPIGFKTSKEAVPAQSPQAPTAIEFRE